MRLAGGGTGRQSLRRRLPGSAPAAPRGVSSSCRTGSQPTWLPTARVRFDIVRETGQSSDPGHSPGLRACADNEHYVKLNGRTVPPGVPVVLAGRDYMPRACRQVSRWNKHPPGKPASTKIAQIASRPVPARPRASERRPRSWQDPQDPGFPASGLAAAEQVERVIASPDLSGEAPRRLAGILRTGSASGPWPRCPRAVARRGQGRRLRLPRSAPADHGPGDPRQGQGTPGAVPGRDGGVRPVR